jgi:hypothetical protein
LTVRRALRLRATTLGAARALEAVMACMVTCGRECAVSVATHVFRPSHRSEKSRRGGWPRMGGCERSDWREFRRDDSKHCQNAHEK